MMTRDELNEAIIKSLEDKIELYKGIVEDQGKIITLLKGDTFENELKT